MSGDSMQQWENRRRADAVSEIAAHLHAASTVSDALAIARDALRLAADLNGYRSHALMSGADALQLILNTRKG